MKGITHFISGMAVASLFPWGTQWLEQGGPYLLLGGAAALLPDTLDFKFCRAAGRVDRHIQPRPDFDADAVADAIVEAVAGVFRAGKPLALKLHTVHAAPGDWLQYFVEFNGTKLRVESGARVSAGLQSLAEGPGGAAERFLSCPVSCDYKDRIEVSIFEGPEMLLIPVKEGVQIHFLPWHRKFTHSLIAALLAGLFCAVLWNPQGGLIAGAAWSVHVIEDQCGDMGSALFHPFNRRRIRGLGWCSSTDRAVNFSVFSGMLILLLLRCIFF